MQCIAQPSRFFHLRVNSETAAEVWKRILEVEFELLASKIIGNSRGDYELKRKIRKMDMSVEAITETKI